ncbi:MAG: agmatine deiminase family protein, partial [Planctomycetota bacterium]
MSRDARPVLIGTLSAFALAATVAAAPADPPVYPEGAAVPRSLTPDEQRFLDDHPLASLRAASPTPLGPVHCVAEYEPMEGLLMAWEGATAWKDLLEQMTVHLTTTGGTKVYMVVDTGSEQTTCAASLAAAGADLGLVEFVVQATDTIWIRDYGPRYVYEGDCRAIVDHTYNRPRPLDNALPTYFGTLKNHARYQIPLVHGGGNYHLNALGESNASRLIVDENPGLTEPQIHALWADYQNVDTSFFDGLPWSVDGTQHIDMWMQVIADDAIVISDWPFNVGSTQDQICDSAAAVFAGRGYTVYRVPARSVGGTHYTYTNVVICNDLVFIPQYTNSQVVQHNTEALQTWRAAMLPRTVMGLDCEGIVYAAGVLHCIVMHVPVPLGGAIPTASLQDLRGGEVLEPAASVEIRWLTDDDVGTTDVDLLLSTNGGTTFDSVIAAGTADDGSHFWTVPDVATTT